MIKGRTVSEVKEINSNQILSTLDGLPESHSHCAKLAADTLQAAVQKYLD
jgi:nitrogen fixation NifU-like protein